MLTNKNKTVLYTGVTNNLPRRLFEHKTNNISCFTSKYKVFYLVYFERFTQIEHAINREKQIKDLKRVRKEVLINSTNPDWRFLNEDILE